MMTIVSSLLAYFLGAIPFGYLFGLLLRGKDIRKAGSGNTGTTNAFRTLGATTGILTLIFDFLKGFLAVLLAAKLAGTDRAVALAAFLVGFGHCYSLFLGGKGGKAVASSAGVLLFVNYKVLLLCLVFFLVLFYAYRIVSICSMSCAVVALISIWLFSNSWEMKLAISLLAILVLYRHRSNWKKLLAGKENRFGKAPVRFQLRGFLLIFVPLLLLSCFLARQWNQGENFRIMEQNPVERSEEGRGVFVFYEFCPISISAKDVASLSKEEGKEGIRYRKGSPLFSLPGSLKKKFLSRNTQIQALLQDQTLTKDHRNSLERESQFLSQSVDQGKLVSPMSGRLSFHPDGFETVISPETMDALVPGDLFAASPVTVPKAQQGMKFVENRSYFFLLDLPRSVQVRPYKVGTTYELKIDSLQIPALLVKSKTDERGRSLLYFQLNQGYDRIKDYRFCDASVVSDKEMGYRLPLSALLAEKDRYYCYVLNEDNIVVKTRVELLDADSEKGEVFVKAEPTKPLEKGERWLALYDRVLQDPGRFKEGALGE